MEMSFAEAFWGAIAQVSVVLALALLVDLRISARRWRSDRLTRLWVEAVAYFLVASTLIASLVVSLLSLRDQANLIPPVWVLWALVVAAAIELWVPFAWALSRAFDIPRMHLGYWAQRVIAWGKALPFMPRGRKFAKWEVELDDIEKTLKEGLLIAAEVRINAEGPLLSRAEVDEACAPFARFEPTADLPRKIGVLYAALPPHLTFRARILIYTSACEMAEIARTSLSEVARLRAQLEDMRHGLARKPAKETLDAAVEGAGTDFLIRFRDI